PRAFTGAPRQAAPASPPAGWQAAVVASRCASRSTTHRRTRAREGITRKRYKDETLRRTDEDFLFICASTSAVGPSAPGLAAHEPDPRLRNGEQLLEPLELVRIPLRVAALCAD